MNWVQKLNGRCNTSGQNEESSRKPLASPANGLPLKNYFNIASIASSSSFVKAVFFNVSRLLSSCATELAPINTVVIRLSFSIQASAICARDWPRCCASTFSFSLSQFFQASLHLPAGTR